MGRLKAAGWVRKHCKCSHNFWTKDTERTTCGDSNCEGSYKFIREPGQELKPDEHKLTYQEAWNGFKQSFTQTVPPHTAIDRYPVVARWRDDVDYVAAGIYCFQPYCVTGELKPPANPLICPQFCLRFNDLDSIGLSGRHYSGFVMIGIQSFYPAGDTTYPKEQLIENNLNWLTKTLKIEETEITFIEDVWAGGGNMGPCVEYFVKGMEVGNMVFNDYKADLVKGTWSELPLRIVDVGIGLERIPFLVNGSPTSYEDVFPEALECLRSRIGLQQTEQDRAIYSKFGKYSCLLNIDECDDIQQTWKDIASHADTDVENLRRIVEEQRDLFLVADHTRTILVAIEDGSLPSSTGGGANLRNLIRRVFSTLKNRNWWSKVGLEGLNELFQKHREALTKLYGHFTTNRSLPTIIELEYQRWNTTDQAAEKIIKDFQKARQKEAQKKSKGGEQVNTDLTVYDWITLSTTHGVMPDQIEAVTKHPIPDNYYTELTEMKEKTTKPLLEGQNLFAVQCKDIPQTVELTYSQRLEDHPEVEVDMDLNALEFEAKVQIVLKTPGKDNVHDLVVLDQTFFYPTSGGQDHDNGKLTLFFPKPEGSRTEGSFAEVLADRTAAVFDVVDVGKAGHCVTHQIVPALTEQQVQFLEKHNQMTCEPQFRVLAFGQIDKERRYQLACHHTATHLIHCAAHTVLGPHVWQASAKKTVVQAHLDITHFAALKEEEVEQIEDYANKLVTEELVIRKTHMKKEDAERQHGFSLYQGGVVPGLDVRVVSMLKPAPKTRHQNDHLAAFHSACPTVRDAAEDDEVVGDVEACCGSHLNNSAQVGSIRILRSNRVSDGVVRIEFVAGPRVNEIYKDEKRRNRAISNIWRVQPTEFEASAQRFFNCFKQLDTQTPKYQTALIRLAFSQPAGARSPPLRLFINQEFTNPTWLISLLPEEAKKTIVAANCEGGDVFGKKSEKWGVVFVGPSYLYGILGFTPVEKKEGKADEKDLCAEEMKAAVEAANAQGPAEGKATPLMIEAGKFKDAIPADHKKMKQMPTWTSTLKCLSLKTTKAVVSYFVDHGFVVVDQ
ncbi:putative Alanine--tRNA ligase [Blattamonas nauphoetae]|uniref:Alanine--tRNA ligase n=1 Tax=Blattamonas nauphoetae TaxID=2049346 RepID=A0ABQ9YKW1_9EUKA|nr:putative Alanine--tRNA ligase [Blattamonas nauphoetae]